MWLAVACLRAFYVKGKKEKKGKCRLEYGASMGPAVQQQQQQENEWERQDARMNAERMLETWRTRGTEKM